MALAPGTQLGSYRIAGPLGAGGMGEVYRATDTRLGREVALKVLPDHLAGFAEARERLEREAKAISSLSHPNICTLYDVGNQDDVSFLVMELLEGETLASRLTRGPLKLDEALRFGSQVADALDKAHRRGIVHRDLKPANLMLTRGGVKVLDFGVAKLREEGNRAAGTAFLPTITPTLATPLTAEGAIVGTMQYMAPEQLEGKPVDSRADIFSLGAVLFETVTGKKAFDGASQAGVIAAILEREPRPVSDLAPASPPSLDRAIQRCLIKDPEERWQSAADVKAELDWIGQQTGRAAAAPRQEHAAPARRMTVSPMAVALLALLSLAMFGLGWLARRPPSPAPSRIVRSTLVIPKGTVLDTDNASLALSPDGTMLAYAGREKGRASQLFVRPLESLTAQPLAGTDDASYPSWSPDGRHLIFFAGQKLKRVPAAGGAVQTICDAEDGRGASWGSKGQIVFAPRAKGGLQVVPASGGSPQPLTTTTDDVVSHRNPHFLPDGERVLFFSGTSARASDNGIHSVDLSSKETRLIQKADSEGIYVEPGYLAFVREGSMMAQPIDLAGLSLSGEAVAIAENVQFNSFRYTGTYAFSNTGLLVYHSGAIQAAAQLTWYGLDGQRLGTVGEPAIFWLGMKISPDGRRAAATIRHSDGGSDLWMYDLARGLGSRFTLGETNALVPHWTPDGKSVIYIDGSGNLYSKATDGAAPARKIFSAGGDTVLPTGFSHDGSKLLYFGQTAETGVDIWVLTMTGDPKPEPFLVTKANEMNARFSPDGRWVAYISDETGRQEAYVSSYPGAAGKWQVSGQGAQACVWSGDGKEIVFVDAEGKWFAAPMAQAGSSSLEIGGPQPLFGGQPLPMVVWDFPPDGKRILGATLVSGDVGPMLTMVANWPVIAQGK